jgi:hypothetical protein
MYMFCTSQKRPALRTHELAQNGKIRRRSNGKNCCVTWSCFVYQSLKRGEDNFPGNGFVADDVPDLLKALIFRLCLQESLIDLLEEL